MRSSSGVHFWASSLYRVYYTLVEIVRRENTDFHLYADDTQLYLKFEPAALSSSTTHMERTIETVHAWMSNNMLMLNTNKTQAMVISSKQHLNTFKDASLRVGDNQIACTLSAVNLGVSFDSSLSMIPHINMCAKSANYHLRNIGRARKFLTKDATERLVHSLVTSRLDYGNSLLINTPKCHLQKLQFVQNTAARIITRTKKYDHISPVLKSLHWLPIEARIKYKICLLTFKTLHDMTPDYLNDLLHRYVPSRSLRSSSSNMLVVPRISTKTYGPKAFSVAAPTLWNSLPDELRHCSSVDVFKSCLKTYLFKLFYSTD